MHSDYHSQPRHTAARTAQQRRARAKTAETPVLNPILFVLGALGVLGALILSHSTL